eukprot:Em0001g962a
MAETAQLIQLLQKQMEEQRKQMEEGQKQTEALIAAFIGQTGQRELEQPSPKAPFVVIPSFDPFDPKTELWDDYWARFQTFVGANSVPVEKRALVFLTNQSCVNYKLLSNLASQQSLPKDVNALMWDEIVEYMKYMKGNLTQHATSSASGVGRSNSPRRCYVQFPCYSGPVGRGNNEAVLKALFKYKEEELTFAKTIAVAMETEKAAKVAKETLCPGQEEKFPTRDLSTMWKVRPQVTRLSFQGCHLSVLPEVWAFGSSMYEEEEGRGTQPVRAISKYQIRTVKATEAVPQLQQSVLIQGKSFTFEVDMGAGDNFCSEDVWCDLGKPPLSPATGRYEDDLDLALQKACEQLCREFPDLFKPELGCLKDFQLEVKFKPDAKPIFCKPRMVPFAIQEDLCQACDAGIARGVWLPTQFNDYGTPVVPFGRHIYPLEPNRHPMPLPEDLMRKLGVGHSFTKQPGRCIYSNQIMLAPESQRRLALSTVLLQTRLPFGISSAPGYFQEIMDQLTSDLQGVAVYMDDILVNGTTASENIQTFVLSSNAWRKRGFAASWRSVYSHNLLSSTWDISYLNRKLPRVLNDGSEHPIANASKTLTNTQRGYSQIQKEALAIIFALNKFHQFLNGRTFILVTDHKPLIALFGPTKATPALAANRLARWALMLSQYQYSIEYRKTSDHGKADALSRLPVGPDSNFDGEEGDADVDTVCTIKTVSLQLKPTDPGTLAKESAKDPIISNVMRYTREGWPPKGSTNEDIKADGSREAFRKLAISLSTAYGCLLYGFRVVIPPSLQPQVLQLLHLGHFGMQRMKQLARTAVYWLGIDADIMELCHRCTACAEHQKKPAKEATRSQAQEAPNRVAPIYAVGTPCYALYCGPRREKDHRWVPAVVTKVYGARSRMQTPGEVQVSSMEPVLVSPLAEVVALTADSSELCVPTAEPTRIPAKPMRVYRNLRLPTGK